MTNTALEATAWSSGKNFIFTKLRVLQFAILTKTSVLIESRPSSLSKWSLELLRYLATFSLLTKFQFGIYKSA